MSAAVVPRRLLKERADWTGSGTSAPTPAPQKQARSTASSLLLRSVFIAEWPSTLSGTASGSANTAEFVPCRHSPDFLPQTERASCSPVEMSPRSAAARDLRTTPPLGIKINRPAGLLRQFRTGPAISSRHTRRRRRRAVSIACSGCLRHGAPPDRNQRAGNFRNRDLFVTAWMATMGPEVAQWSFRFATA